jgi:hypothetical protein
MSRVVVLLVVAVLASCERTPDAPTNPAPTPTPTPVPTARALLRPNGTFTFDRCTFGPSVLCAFSASLLNEGVGCATQVQGTVRLFDSVGLQLGNAYRFALPSQQIVVPNERVAFVVNFVPLEAAQRTVTNSIDPAWVDTPCR